MSRLHPKGIAKEKYHGHISKFADTSDFTEGVPPPVCRRPFKLRDKLYVRRFPFNSDPEVGMSFRLS